MTDKERRRRARKMRKIRILIYNILILILFIIIVVLVMQKTVKPTENGSEVGSEVTTDNSALLENNLSSDDVAAFTLTKAKTINSYGENINIALSDDNYNETYTLYNTGTKETSDSFEMSELVDEGLNANDLPVGSYILQLSDGSYLSYDDDFEISFNTITRDGLSNPIKVTVDEGLVHITKEEAIENNEELDILVDAGHGGIDSGASSLDGTVNETEINLEVATILANKLEAMGYNVGITRTDETQPGQDSCDEVNTAYCDGGRVTQAYDQKAKLFVSIHHNTMGLDTGIEGDKTGFEIYSSTYSSHNLAKLIVNNLSSVSEPSTKIDGKLEEGLYSRTYDDDDGLVKDYYYQIREVGGSALMSLLDDNKPNNESVQGSEAVLIELGYLDNNTDLAHLTDPEVQDAEAQAIADAVDEYINTSYANGANSEVISEHDDDETSDHNVTEEELQEF